MAARFDAAVALVDQHDRQTEAAVQLTGKALAARAHVVIRAIGMTGPANDQPRWPPLLDQKTDRREAFNVIAGVDHAQCAGIAGDRVTDRDPNPRQAKIE